MGYLGLLKLPSLTDIDNVEESVVQYGGDEKSYGMVDKDVDVETWCRSAAVVISDQPETLSRVRSLIMLKYQPNATGNKPQKVLRHMEGK